MLRIPAAGIEASAHQLARVAGVLESAAGRAGVGALGDASAARVLRVSGRELTTALETVVQVGDAASPLRTISEPLRGSALALSERSGMVRAAGLVPQRAAAADEMADAAQRARDAAGMLGQEAHYARTAQGAPGAIDDTAFPVRVDDLTFPAPGSRAEAREIAQLERRARSRTARKNADTILYGAAGSQTVWPKYVRLIQQRHGPERAAAVQADLQRAWDLAVDVSERLKELLPRQRPWTQSRLLKQSQIDHHPTSLSFPSGHTTVAYASASVMAHHWPARSDEFYAIAEQVGRARLNAGVHYPSDVRAGKLLGERIAEVVLRRHNVV